jgi:hypothetical protein
MYIDRSIDPIISIELPWNFHRHFLRTWRLADGVLAAIPELNHVIEMPQVGVAAACLMSLNV